MKWLRVLAALLIVAFMPHSFALSSATPASPEAERAATLVKQLGEEKRQSRMGAVRALKLTGPEAVPALLSALKDGSELRRTYAAVALAELVESNPEQATAGLSVMIEALRKGFKKNTWDIKVDVAAALGKLGPAGKPAEAALSAAVDRSGTEFLEYAQSTQGRPVTMPDWDPGNDLPPYPFILTRFNSEGSEALKRIRGESEARARGWWIDPSTKLMWTQKDNGSEVMWSAAKAYCENLTLGNHVNWRLASIEELEKIYDAKRSQKGDCVGAGGSWDHHVKAPIELSCGYVWSSTMYGSGNAWCFDFHPRGRGRFRFSSSLSYSNNNRALCVRVSEE